MKKTLIAAAFAAASLAPVTVMAQAPATAPASSTPTVGAKVYAPDGSEVGTVETVANNVVTVQTGTVRAGLPTSAFVMRDKGLTIGMTKAQLETAVNSAKQQSTAALDTALVAGAPIKSNDGVMEGTVTKVDGDNVTFKLPNESSVVLKKPYFTVAGDGSLQLAMTDAGFKAALGTSEAAAGATGAAATTPAPTETPSAQATDSSGN